MDGQENKKANGRGKFFASLIIFSLVGQIAWVVENMYFNVFIYNTFGATADEINLMVALSSVAATLATLLVGAWSDKVGKRKIFISVGYILWGVSILCFAFLNRSVLGAIFPVATVMAAGVTITIILDFVMTLFGSSANDACFNAWLTDSTSEKNRGLCEGINSMMPLLAILVVFGGAMLIPIPNTEEAYWTIIFSIIGGIVIVIGILGFFLIKDPVVDTKENQSYFKNIIYGLRPSVVKKNPKLYIYLILFTIFGTAIQVFMPHLIIYYERGNIEGLDNYVLIMAPAIVLAAIFTGIWGKVYDKLKFNKSMIPPLALLIAGFITLFVSHHVVPVFIGSLLMMCGYLSGNAVFGAVIRENTPESKSGMFQGLRIICQVLLPSLIGPLISSLALKDAEKFVDTSDNVEKYIPNTNIFLGALIVICVLVLLFVGAWFLTRYIDKKREGVSSNEENQSPSN